MKSPIKQEKKKKNDPVSIIASTIIQDREEEILEQPEPIEEVVTTDEDQVEVTKPLKSTVSEKIKEKFSLKTDPVKKENEIPKRIEFTAGINRQTAFVIQKNEREIADILNSFFGNVDGDYFAFRCVQEKIQNKTYKVFSVQDKNEFSYQIWFDVSNISFLANIKYQH